MRTTIPELASRDDPETLLDLTAGGLQNLLHSERYLPGILEPYVYYKVLPEAYPGSGISIGRHGDFDNAPFWRESFRVP